MNKARASVLAVLVCAVLAVAALAGCGGSSSSSASASVSASSSAASSASASASSASAEGFTIDGVIIKDISLDMVGETPNLSIVFSNPTDKAVDVDCSKFVVTKDDGTVVDFGKSTKTIDANQKYMQWAFTAKSGSLQEGDRADISYDGTSLGTFEVTKF